MKIQPIHRSRLPGAVGALGALLLTCASLLAEEQKGALNPHDEGFVKQETMAGMATVKVGELGSIKAQSYDVRMFASLIVTEHNKINTDLKLLATDKGVEFPTTLDAPMEEAYRKLDRASGSEFDQLFLAELESGHKHCVSHFEAASREVKDPDLKYWLDKTLPVLKQHHQRISQLSTCIIAQAGSPSERGPRSTSGSPGSTLTPFDQGSSAYDTETTASIRREIMASGQMSFTAQNVKIITTNGRVTLRGPVNTDQEKRIIAELAARHVSPTHLDNHLEVAFNGRP